MRGRKRGHAPGGKGVKISTDALTNREEPPAAISPRRHLPVWGRYQKGRAEPRRAEKGADIRAPVRYPLKTRPRKRHRHGKRQRDKERRPPRR